MSRTPDERAVMDLDGAAGDMIDIDQYDWDEDLTDQERSAAARESASLRARRAIEKLQEQRELRGLLVDFPD